MLSDCRLLVLLFTHAYYGDTNEGSNLNSSDKVLQNQAEGYLLYVCKRIAR
jgi:hypothetical protein